MKKIYLALFVIFVTNTLKAQDNTVLGSVQDETGKPLHFVFVEDSKYETAVFSDSLGNFSIPVHPDSKLQFMLEGRKQTVVTSDKIAPNLVIVLKSFADTLSPKITVETNNVSHRAYLGEDGQLYPSKKRLKSMGTRYFFEAFAHGYLVDMSGRRVFDQSYLLDYDKVSGLILITADKINVMQIAKDQIKSFVLYGNSDQRAEFEKVPAIDAAHYVQVLSAGKKYKIYKFTKTGFDGADYSNTAAGQRGHDYDEYVDEAEYYALDVKSNQLQKLSLRKKSIRTVFAKEADKVNKFLSEDQEDIDDTYLVQLGEIVNE
jgi:hypothetical protein